jgi:hypothetical protein
LEAVRTIRGFGAPVHRASGGNEKLTSGSEQVEFAELCHFKKHYAAAARFYRDAFTAEPKLADAVPEFTRYNAACDAALTRSGRGADAEDLNESERARWGRQAVDWLRQDLDYWNKALVGGDASARLQVQQKLRHWQLDPDFSGVRGLVPLSRPPAPEREQWTSLWSDVDALLRRASKPE